jgi:hypothetical protein
MAVILSPCFKSFILALNSPLRAQFRQLLYICQTMLKAELTKQVAMISRNDVVVGYYKLAADQINSVLRPIEQAMNLIPFSTLQGCTEGTALQGNLLLAYYQKKALAQDLSYQVAQNGFASAYVNHQYEQFQKALDKITSVMQAMDDIGLLTIAVPDHVRIFSTNNTGIISSITGNNVTVTLDAPLIGTVTRPAGDIGRIA